jgi:RNA polymerase sigma factor (sigma-70 family)
MNQKKKKTSKPATAPPVEQLIAEYGPRLKAFILSKVASREDAEDILQDVFYQFIKAAQNALNPIEQASAWLYRVARNTIINHGTRKHEEPMPAFDDDYGEYDVLEYISGFLFDKDNISPSPETEYLRSLVWRTLETALAELPAAQREIFELTELDNIPLKDISQATGVPVNTLLSRKHYAVLHLRKRLKDLYVDILS